MNRIRLLYIVLLVNFCFVPYLTAETNFKAGVAKAVITPDYNMWMAGYAARDHPSEGKYHDLYAKSLAVQDEEGTKIVWITTDLIGLSNSISEKVAQAVNEKTGLPRSSILLTSSHTHSGPELREKKADLYNLPKNVNKKINQYREELTQKLIDVILASLNNLEPAQLYRGNGIADFAVNRREYTLNGVIIGENPIGPVDHDVPVMKVVDENSEIMAIVFGYACHNTTLNFYKFCGDYAGYAQAYLEEKYPSAAAMFFSGCAGDSNPSPRRKLEYAKRHGRELADSVQKVLSAPMKQIDGQIHASFSRIDLSLSPIPDRDTLKKRMETSNKYLKHCYKLLIEKLDKGEQLPTTYSYPVQVWHLDDNFNIIALAGEVVVDYSLWYKHKYGQDNVWVVAYANEVFGYIPSLRVLREGGYEADRSMIYSGFHGPWAPQIENKIHTEVDDHIRYIRSHIKNTPNRKQ